MDGVQRIAAERQRQIEAEGWTAEHDTQHDREELARVAALYAIPARLRPDVVTDGYLWPTSWAKEWWKPSPPNRIHELEKAGALIAAEIDRLLAADRPAASDNDA